MMSAKLVTLGLLKINIFRNKDYDFFMIIKIMKELLPMTSPTKVYHVTEASL